MRTLFTFLLTLTTSFAFAQPVLTKHLQYDTWDTYSIEGCGPCDTTGMEAIMVDTGPNHTWNLNVAIQGTRQVSFVKKIKSHSGAQFPDANLVLHFNGGTTYTFYQKTATELKYVANEIGGAPSVVFSPSRTVEKWPFAYNDSFSESVSATFPQTNKTGTNYYTHKADGYGTLVVNGITYPNVVLRTLTKSESVDMGSIAIETSETARWWDTAHKTALLEIKRYSAGVSGNISYTVNILKQETLGGIKDLSNRYANITAHTQNGQLSLVGALETGKEYQLHLYNTTGQRITSTSFTATGQQYSTPVQDMPSGIYYIHLQGRGDAPGYIKFLHQ